MNLLRGVMKMSKKILVVDDEPKIVSMIKNYLDKEGFTVITASNGETALASFQREAPALIVLDWMMPDLNGLQVLQEIRKSSNVPVIMLTSKADEVDKLLGLEIGADDYITKPFSLRELVARIKVVLRRFSPVESKHANIVTIGGLEIDVGRHSVYVEGKAINNLTPTEFKLLSFLAQNPEKVFSRLQLMDSALGEAYEGYERSLDTHVSNLRKKIEQDPANPGYITTVYGVGYKMSGGSSK